MKKSGLILVAVIVCLAFIVVSFINVSAKQKLGKGKDKKLYPIDIPKTGQTNSDAHTGGDDGDLQIGLQWPDPRFTDNDDGTVTDNLTNLVWLKNADCFGEIYWYGALDRCNFLGDGYCGLSDNSFPGDWRLPNRNELLSLLDLGNYLPPLPDGHPFINVREGNYWTSTIAMRHFPTSAWYIYTYAGSVNHAHKSSLFYVLPVRSYK